MNNFLSEPGSAKFKNLIVTAKNVIPGESNIGSLNNLIDALITKKNEINNSLNSQNISAGQRNTLKTYLDDIHEVINLTERRINQLNNVEVGGKRRRRKSFRRRLSRKKTSSKRKRTFRKRH